MKNVLLVLAPLFLALISCKPNKIEEGEVEYTITYPHGEITGFMQAILPETMTITFKGTKMKTTIARGEIFTTEIISDEADRSVEMRLDFGDQLYYTILNADEVQEMISSQPHYDLKSLGQNDSISGMYATSYSVTCKNDTIPLSDAWFTEDLIFTHAYWFTPYADVKGFPLVYDAGRYGVMMHLEAVKLTKREVNEKEFDRDPALVKVSFEEYEAEVQELFDILKE